MNNETKIKQYIMYKNSSIEDLVLQDTVLGYQIISTSVNKSILTVTYQRNTDIKFLERFKDLEHKFARLDSLINNYNGYIAKIANNNSEALKNEKIISWFTLFLGILGSLYFITSIVLSFSYGVAINYTKNLILLLIIVLFWLIQVFWMRSIKKRGNIKPYQDALVTLKNQKHLLIRKAKNISKE